jgi:hypothetical protein
MKPCAGDVVYLHVFGQGIVFLNSVDAVNELMDKRGAIYSDRVPMVMASELCVVTAISSAFALPCT